MFQTVPLCKLCLPGRAQRWPSYSYLRASGQDGFLCIPTKVAPYCLLCAHWECGYTVKRSDESLTDLLLINILLQQAEVGTLSYFGLEGIKIFFMLGTVNLFLKVEKTRKK